MKQNQFLEYLFKRYKTSILDWFQSKILSLANTITMVGSHTSNLKIKQVISGFIE